ncbi:MAG: hypothetical protein ACRD2W_24890 [Acidimicrobiales bacterium]
MKARRLLAAGVVCVALASSALTSPAQADRYSPEHPHWGWAQSTVLEQFGVTATEDYVEMLYYENCCGVYDPSWWDWYTYHSSWPGWSRTDYGGGIYTFGGVDKVGVEGWSGWTNFWCQCDYGQWEYYESGDGYWFYQGGLYYGSLPYAWDFRYYGGRYD